MKKGLLTRFIIHEILYLLRTNNKNFNEILDNYLIKYNLSLRDRKMVHNVCLNSMRYHLYIDKILKTYVKKKINTNQYILLLSAITQIIYLKFKDYAVVDSTVDLAKKKNIYPGFINAVLKKIISDKKKLLLTKIDFVELPNWFISQNSDKSKKEKNNFLFSILQKPSLHIVFKDKNFINSFNQDYVLASEKSIFVKNFSSIESLPRYKDGEWWVQDFISMLPISMIKNIAKKEIIDLCAAPGGKSFQILSQNDKLLMYEINTRRALVLKQNLKRLGYINNVNINDSRKINTNSKFDIVILDVPCSSVGTVRRNPEILFRSKEPNLKIITKIQKELLDTAKKIVKKNGIILYMACSFLSVETTNQIKKFLNKNDNFILKKFKPENDFDCLIDKNGYIKTMPIKFREFYIDGFFAAQLKRND